MKDRGQGRPVGGIGHDERQYAEGNVHCQQCYEAVAGCRANMNINRIKPLAEGIEEEENGEVEENGDTISQASHLEFGEAIKEISAHSTTCVRRGTWL